MAVLTEEKAEKFLSKYAPVAKSVMTKTPAQAVAAAGKLKLPVVLKLISKKAIHKTEVNGVRIVSTLDDLRREYADIQRTAKSKKLPVEGILVQEFIKGHELIIGLKIDPTFGPVIALGIGGKYVEIIKDITFRACPLTPEEAKDMIQDLKYKKIIMGARGAKPANLALLARTLVDISKLGAEGYIEELDINPFIINDKTGKVVDARIKMK